MKERIVCVEWYDASSNSGYFDEKDPDRYAPTRTRTVGHLVKSTPQVVIVSKDRFYLVNGKQDGDRNTSTIPRKMIKKVTELKG
jgi:hypothetical protein